MNVSANISSLVQYGLDCALIDPCDTIFMTNQLLQALCLDSFEPAAPVALPLEEILKGLLDDAVER
ncbi:MAG: galactose-1-phosphate uridylyltransferase, partial [Faecousia sp.]